VKQATVAEVIRAIEAAQAELPGGAIAFDGDGTLWAGDIGEDFFAALLGAGLAESVREPLAREAEEAGLDANGTAGELASRIHRAYLGGAFPEERVCEIMTWAPAGKRRDDLDRFCESVIDSIHLSTRLHGEAISVLTRVRQMGIDVFLVSASPRAIVDQAARLVGISADYVVAARERVDEAGFVNAAVDRPIPYAAGKVTRLREKLERRPLYAAFGDNAFDVAMLREAKVPVAIRPKPRLVERREEVPALVVLERL
jgi:HAD superfamily phosphoserine phosphatase-like hydrolase